MANAAARQSSASTITTPMPVAPPIPSMFASASVAAAAVATAHGVSGRSLDRRIPHLDDRTERAVSTYDAMNEDNRRSLSAVPE